MMLSLRAASCAALVLVFLCVSSAEFLPHALTGHDISGEAWAYSQMFFDPSWGELGRVVLLPAALKIDVGDCAPGPCNCSVSYAPDPTLWYFNVSSRLGVSDSIGLTAVATTNMGPELLTPGASVYIPAHNGRPPLIFSFGGADVNLCSYPSIHATFERMYTPWCFSPTSAVHILRLDTLEWLHAEAPGNDLTGLSNLSQYSLYSLGAAVVYDGARDTVMLTAGYYVADENGPWTSYPCVYAMDLGVLRSTRLDGKGAGQLDIDSLYWRLVNDELVYDSMGLGLLVVDPTHDRLVQYGGTDPFRRCNYDLFSVCSSFDLTTYTWAGEFNCSFTDVDGPFQPWDAAIAPLPGRRKILFLGGRQTVAHSYCVFFSPTDAHWALDLDTMSWERLVGDKTYWGLPQLSGARAIAAPLPDGSVAVYVWGGLMNQGAPSTCGYGVGGLSSFDFSCGVSVKAELAYPSLFRASNTSLIYYLSIPPAIYVSPRRTSVVPTALALCVYAFAVLAASASTIAHSVLLARCAWRAWHPKTHEDPRAFGYQASALIFALPRADSEPAPSVSTLVRQSRVSEPEESARIPSRSLLFQRQGDAGQAASGGIALPDYARENSRIPRQYSEDVGTMSAEPGLGAVQSSVSRAPLALMRTAYLARLAGASLNDQSDERSTDTAGNAQAPGLRPYDSFLRVARRFASLPAVVSHGSLGTLAVAASVHIASTSPSLPGAGASAASLYAAAACACISLVAAAIQLTRLTPDSLAIALLATLPALASSACVIAAGPLAIEVTTVVSSSPSKTLLVVIAADVVVTLLLYIDLVAIRTIAGVSAWRRFWMALIGRRLQQRRADAGSGQASASLAEQLLPRGSELPQEPVPLTHG